MSDNVARISTLHPSSLVTQPPPHRPDGENAQAGAKIAGTQAQQGVPKPQHTHRDVLPSASSPRVLLVFGGGSLMRLPIQYRDGTSGAQLLSLLSLLQRKPTETPAVPPHSEALKVKDAYDRPFEHDEGIQGAITSTQFPLEMLRKNAGAVERPHNTAPAAPRRAVAVLALHRATLAQLLTLVAIVQMDWTRDVTRGGQAAPDAAAQQRCMALCQVTYITAICVGYRADGQCVVQPELELRLPH